MQRYTDDSGWGSGHGIPQTIENVRVESVKALRTGGTNFDSISNDILFIDAVNSKPFLTPKEKDIINFNGAREVVEIKTLNSNTGIHHLEVKLK